MNKTGIPSNDEITIAIVDLDGTLLNDRKEISARNHEALTRWNGSGRSIVLASARPPRVMRPIVAMANFVDYWICYNGARAYAGDKTILDRAMPARSIATWVSGVLARYPDLMVCLEMDDTLFSNMPPTRFFGDTPWARLEIEKIDPESRVSKIIVEYDVAVEREIADARIGESTITDGRTIVQIAPPGTNKKNAIENILELECRSWRNCIAFGDDNNDAKMMKAAAISVAMENGEEEIVGIATLRTSSNNDDGVGRVLERLLDS